MSFHVARIACAMSATITMVAMYDLFGGTAVLQQDVSGRPSVPSLRAVWSAGWITAVSTGLGVLPFAAFRDVKTVWLGACNALASGMMAAASVGLLFEAMHTREGHHTQSILTARLRALVGAVAGVLFTIGLAHAMEKYEHLKFSGFSGSDANKMLLIVVVMMVHSLAEGIGIGVSFAGDSGSQFGMFISSALAVHNVPEGLAICLVLVPRGVGLLEASMWSVFSSITQPLLAVPAFMAAQAFLPMLPLGLGFASGAMLYVAFFELLPSALEGASRATVLAVASVAAAAMGTTQYLLK